MNVLIAPDSFKDSLSAKDVAGHVEKGIRNVLPGAKITKIPLSDGGEGLLEALIEPLKGKMIECVVNDPLKRNITAKYGIVDSGHTAVIEMARASGLELLKPSERNPLLTTTYGTGQLIKDALDKGCKKLIIGLGGSATNDGGMGLMKALGVEFLNSKNELIDEGGGALENLKRVDVSKIDKRLSTCEIIAACDVTNPLTGVNGSSLIFGAQKGGSTEALIQLDKNLSNYAAVIKRDLGKELRRVKGSGAAGGTAMGLLAFLDAELKPGIDLIMKELQIEKHIKAADVVITGEGQIDTQTLSGKTIAGLAKMAKKHHVPVVAIAGKIDNNPHAIYDLGITAMFSIINQPMDLQASINQTGELIENCVMNIFRLLG